MLYNLTKNINIAGLGIWLKKSKTLIISDIHLGIEKTIQKQGILIPIFHLRDILKQLKKVLEETKPETIVINGDFKHEFGKISDQEWRDSVKLISFLKKYSKNIIILKGNHDNILKPIAEKTGVELKQYHIIDSLLVLHGDVLPEKLKICLRNIKTIVIGHEHPVISLYTKVRTERYKCFLKGKYKKKQLIILPSVNPLLKGTDILSEKLLSPFLKDISGFEVFAIADKVYKCQNFPSSL